MLLYSAIKSKIKNLIIIKSVLKKSSPNNNLRKDMRSPRKGLSIIKNQGTGGFFFAPLKGSLTVETALVLPLFLFFMITVLQYGRCMETAVQFGNALAETGKNMAVSAYMTRYGGDTGSAADVVTSALSAAYAKSQVMSRTSDTSCIRNANMLLSSFLEEDEMIRLVLTYQVKTPIGTVKLPWNFFIQSAFVRAWTGRETGTGTENSEGGENADDYVYVTITGSVYHEDPDCTHLKLSVREVSAVSVPGLRNNNGAIYHVCEKCGNFGSSTVYITNEGNRYHSSLSCSGLKRTVRKITREEVSQMRCCSKCGTY